MVRGVFARRYDGDGTALDDAPLQLTAGNPEASPAVTVADDGAFTVAWMEGVSGGLEVRLQRFDAESEAQGPVEIVDSGFVATRGGPAISSDALGNFVVAWGRLAGDPDGFVFRQYDANGDALGDVVLVDDGLSSLVGDPPDVSVAPDGTFAVGWREGTWGFIQRYLADGSPNGGQLQLASMNVTSPGGPYDSSRRRAVSVSMSDDGSFAAGYMDGSNVTVERFDADGASLGAENIASGQNTRVFTRGCIDTIVVTAKINDVPGLAVLLEDNDANHQPDLCCETR